MRWLGLGLAVLCCGSAYAQAPSGPMTPIPPSPAEQIASQNLRLEDETYLLTQREQNIVQLNGQLEAQKASAAALAAYWAAYVKGLPAPNTPNLHETPVAK